MPLMQKRQQLKKSDPDTIMSNFVPPCKNHRIILFGKMTSEGHLAHFQPLPTPRLKTWLTSILEQVTQEHVSQVPNNPRDADFTS